MSRRNVSIASLVVVFTMGAFFAGSGVIARAQDDAPERITQRFVGEDDRGNFQAALEDALIQADAYYAQQGADVLYNYRVRSTSGERGGFAFMNIVRVELITSSPF